MAKFVLAGQADCPDLAKAELLAERLLRSLPNFRFHKISVLPGDWKEWLERTCKANIWEHHQSPVIWRELVEQGGKGMLLGGFRDFCEHCQRYYGISSDTSSDLEQSIAAENLVDELKMIEEEKHRLSLVQPLHIWITSALNPTCPCLIPHLISSEVFPQATAISLHLLHLGEVEEDLRRLQVETEELALPLLHQVSVHMDLEEAFEEADVILLLEDIWLDEGPPDEEKIRDQYSEYGQLMEVRANREVKVIVSGGSFVNLRCSLLINNARSIDARRFVAVATQLENEARAILAKRLNVRSSDVQDVIVWGNISGSFYIDLQRAKVTNYPGAIKAPASVSQPLQHIFHDRGWVETEFQELVRNRRVATATSQRRGGAAMSSTNGILSVMKAWNAASGPSELLSVGVSCSGLYDLSDLPEGAVLSVPVTVSSGHWAALSDVTVGEDLRDKLQSSASELTADTPSREGLLAPCEDTAGGPEEEPRTETETS